MEQSSEVKALTLRIYEALTKGDHAFFERHVSRERGVLAIGTDPNEWWAGTPTFTKVLKAQLEETGGFPIIADSPEAYSEGNVAWAAGRPKFKFPDGKEIPVRLTFVFRRESSEWKVVQWHASVGVANEDLLGKELTT